jgi:hypothetical protein
MMRDTIMTFTHERFGSIRSVRLRTDCYVVAEDLYKALGISPETAERVFRDEKIQPRYETLPWVMGHPLEPRRKVALLNLEAIHAATWISPVSNAHRIGIWIREVVLPMTEFISREEMRFGAVDIAFRPADAWKYHGPDPSEALFDTLD